MKEDKSTDGIRRDTTTNKKHHNQSVLSLCREICGLLKTVKINMIWGDHSLNKIIHLLFSGLTDFFESVSTITSPTYIDSWGYEGCKSQLCLSIVPADLKQWLENHKLGNNLHSLQDSDDMLLAKFFHEPIWFKITWNVALRTKRRGTLTRIKKLTKTY